MKLLVKSKSEHFIRAGIAFSKEATEIDVNPDIATVLINEPMLIAEVISEPVPQHVEKPIGAEQIQTQKVIVVKPKKTIATNKKAKKE